MVAFTLFSSCFKRKRKMRSASEVEGKVGVRHAVNAVKMIDHKPNSIQFIQSNLHLIVPAFVTVTRGPPVKVPDVSEGDDIVLNRSGRDAFTIRRPGQLQRGFKRTNAGVPDVEEAEQEQDEKTSEHPTRQGERRHKRTSLHAGRWEGQPPAAQSGRRPLAGHRFRPSPL